MRKRPSQLYRILHAPIPLPEHFPIISGPLSQQGDTVITWLHGHDCLEIGYCHEGSGIFVIGNKVLPFQAGDVSVITPAEPHLAQSALGTKSRWTWIYLDPFRLLQTVPSEAEFLTTGNLAGPRFRNLIVPRKDPFIGSLTRELVGELQKRPRAYQTSVKALVWSLMVRLQRLAPSRTSILVSSIEPAMRRIAPALDLMAKTYANRSDARRWARCCHLSATHFRRLFRKAMGKSPHAYLTELRVRMTASRLHSTDEKIITISLEAGFPSPSSLNRAFRRVIKTTPREWRALK